MLISVEHKKGFINLRPGLARDEDLSMLFFTLVLPVLVQMEMLIFLFSVLATTLLSELKSLEQITYYKEAHIETLIIN